MVRVVLIYGPTSPRLRADLSSLTTCLGPSCPRAELSGTPLVNISALYCRPLFCQRGLVGPYIKTTRTINNYCCLTYFFNKIDGNHKDTVWHLSTVLGNVKSEPYSCRRIPFPTGVYIYLVTTAGVFKYDRMWRMINKLMCFHIYEKHIKIIRHMRSYLNTPAVVTR
jgi:hypothetical protein